MTCLKKRSKGPFKITLLTSSKRGNIFFQSDVFFLNVVTGCGGAELFDAKLE